MRKLSIPAVLLWALLFAAVAQAQLAPIKGVVRDSSTGLPLAGVTVLIKGTATFVTTDSLGRFSLEIDTSASVASEVKLPGGVADAWVVCRIYDIRGRCLRTFSGEPAGVGNSRVSFERTLPNGLYLVRITGASERRVMKRMVIR